MVSLPFADQLVSSSTREDGQSNGKRKRILEEDRDGNEGAPAQQKRRLQYVVSIDRATGAFHLLIILAHNAASLYYVQISIGAQAFPD